MKKAIIIIISLFLVYGCAVKETPSLNIEVITPAETPIKETIHQPDNVTLNYCQEFCYFVRSGEQSALKYNQNNQTFSCQCFDYGKELLVSKEITERDLALYGKKMVQWESMPITYQLMNEEDCGSYETRKIQRAFKQIQDTTNNVVRFQQVQENASIELTCKYIKDCYQKKIDIRREEGVIYEYEGICAHEAGVAKMINYEGFTIKKATIDLVGLAGFAETSGHGASGFYIGSCGHPTVEIHEILHTLGFGHVNDPESIMYFQAELVPYTLLKEGGCIGSDKKIDQDIIDDLLFIYG